MHGWMDRQVEGWMEEQTDKQMDGAFIQSILTGTDNRQV